MYGILFRAADDSVILENRALPGEITMTIQQQFESQCLLNGYALINGVDKHAELGERFQIVNPWFRRNANVGHFVELRIDSDRFSAHPDAPEACECPHCNEAAENPILCHEEPGSLVAVPLQSVPSRGWGEQFWVQITQRDGPYLVGAVDNTLYESRLHGLNPGDSLCFHEDHILAVHGIHNEDIIRHMNKQDFEEFGRWVMDCDPSS